MNSSQIILRVLSNGIPFLFLHNFYSDVIAELLHLFGHSYLKASTQLLSQLQSLFFVKRQIHTKVFEKRKPIAKILLAEGKLFKR